jgi:hypothetical protein
MFRIIYLGNATLQKNNARKAAGVVEILGIQIKTKR